MPLQICEFPKFYLYKTMIINNSDIEDDLNINVTVRLPQSEISIFVLQAVSKERGSKLGNTSGFA